MIKPMLAYKLNQHKINFKEFIYMQPKLDGVRCLFTKDGAFSRTGKQFMNVKHIEKSLKDYFEQNPAMVLDGELYNHNLRNDFEKIISLVRKQKPTDEDRSEAHRLTQYHVYDYTNTSMSNMVNYKYRLNQLTCSDIYTSSIHYVESRRVKSMKQAKDFHIRKLAEGYEGSILRTNKPVITVKTSKSNDYGHEVAILGPSKVIYSPDKPLSCGARVWIETEAEVKIA